MNCFDYDLGPYLTNTSSRHSSLFKFSTIKTFERDFEDSRTAIVHGIRVDKDRFVEHVLSALLGEPSAPSAADLEVCCQKQVRRLGIAYCRLHSDYTTFWRTIDAVSPLRFQLALYGLSRRVLNKGLGIFRKDGRS